MFRAKFEEKYGSKVEDNRLEASREWVQTIHGTNHTWEDVAFLRRHWDGPLILKGIQHVEDAKKCIEIWM